MKRLFVLCLLFTVGSLFAQTTIFTGLGMEVNANTRKGAAFGGGMSVGMDLNQSFSLGLKAAFSTNMDTVNTLEPSAFFRYYLPFKFSGLFAQAEMGTAIYFEDNKSYPSFLAGLAFGWHYNMEKRWYIEPSIRGGYPFAWGIGLQAGMSFDL